MVLSICGQPPSITPDGLSYVLTNVSSLGTANLIPNLQGMINECSHTKSSFSTYIVPEVITVPCLNTQCNVEDWANYADSFVENNLKINVRNFIHRIYVLSNGVGCGFGGLGYMAPCEDKCRIWISGQIPDKVEVYFHELGHNLGLTHAEANNDQYGDTTDAMGYCCNVRCFAAPNSFRLRWSQPSLTLHVPLYVVQDFDLAPSEYIMISDDARKESIFIQFRVANANIYERDVGTEVNIYVVPYTPGALTHFETALSQPLHTWQNAISVHVTLIQISSTSASVRIEPLWTVSAPQNRYTHIPV